MAETLTEAVKSAARALGFDLVGVARAEALDPRPLDRWLANGFAGQMSWMAERREERLDPRTLLKDARSVIAVAMNYWHPDPNSARTPRVARYARGRDYHNVLRRRLRKLRRLLLELRPDARVAVSVDHAPVMEKAWAERAGLGWIGKSGNLLTERFGTWVLLGALVTDVELEPDTRATDHCGTCTLCIEACPTRAIVAPGVVDARKCISYLTIEHEGPLTEDLHGWAFGCDVCQDVCPWSQKNTIVGNPAFAPTRAGASVDAREIAGMDEAEFARRYGGTPLARPGIEGMKRNVRGRP